MATGEAVAARDDVERAVTTIEREAEAIERRELEEAFRALEDRGDLTDEHREAIEALADGIVASLVGGPVETLRRAERECDDATVAAAIRLFDPGT